MRYGVLNLLKPPGPTSRDCVNQIAKRVKKDKVAHAGTLDPLAQGVLLILVGPAVRLMDEIHLLDKEYEACFRWGHRSPSCDLETPLEDVPLPAGFDERTIDSHLSRFVGEIEQIPSAYSAIRVGGKRAHQSARRGTEVQIPARRVTVYDLRRLPCDWPEMRLRIRCSTGTYIRTLGSDIARWLGTDAVMTQLVRSRVGPFDIRSSVAIDSIPDPFPDELLQPAIAALPDWDCWPVDDALMRRILDGQRLAAAEVRPTAQDRLAVLDQRAILRAIVKRFPDGTWRCEKGIAHWDIYP